MPSTGMIGVKYNNNFEEMKKNIKLMAQKGEARTSKINAFLLEKRSMDELLKYAEDLTKRLRPYPYYNTANSFKKHFEYLRGFGWLIEEKNGYFQIIGYRDSKSASQFSTEQVKIMRKERDYLPTKADCERVIEKLKVISKSPQIHSEDVLNILEQDFKKQGITLQDNWKRATKVNFKTWFS